MRTVFLAITLLGGVLALQPGASAQSLTFSVLGRYLELLQERAGIPGMSGLVSQHGVVLWSWSNGDANVAAATPATIDTPYLVGGVSQTLGASLVLRQCVDERVATVSDRVASLVHFPEPATKLSELLAHVTPTGTFRYDPSRFAVLTGVSEACSGVPYGRLLAQQIFDRFGMVRSVPGTSVAVSASRERALFEPGVLLRYEAVLRELAVPYRVARGRVTPTDLAPTAADAAQGVVTTVGDYARFIDALDAGALVTPASRAAAWTQVTVGPTPMPTGLGWFVQQYQGQTIVWQFGSIDGGHSALVVKVPGRGLTFVLMANAEGLAPLELEKGDVTASLFAQTFLRLVLP